MSDIYNGMPAAELLNATWQKSKHSNPNGACVEVAHLATGEIAVDATAGADAAATVTATVTATATGIATVTAVGYATGIPSGPGRE